jgi:hypothetical protein
MPVHDQSELSPSTDEIKAPEEHKPAYGELPLSMTSKRFRAKRSSRGRTGESSCRCTMRF